MSINDIVDVEISRKTTAISKKGFGTALIFGIHTKFSQRLKYYGSIDEVAADFSSADEEYKTASKLLSQDQKPERIAIGRRVDGENLSDELSSVVEENDDWYGLIICKRSTAQDIEDDIKEAAEWTEPRFKIFGTSVNDTNVTGSGSSDVASFLKDKGYDRTFIMYSSDSESYPEAAWMGLQFPKDPGSSTWKFKSLSGITVDELGSDKITNAKSKNCNVYIKRGGVSMTEEGVMASGEFIDVIRGIDWFVARSQERIFSRLTDEEKIPYTDTGIGTIESELRVQIREAIRKDVLAAEPEPVINVPKVSDISKNDRALRYLPDIKFEARLSGAIHKVKIRGTVTV